MFNLLKMDKFVPALQRIGRREPRHATSATVTLSCPALGVFAGVLIDLSVHGACVRTRAKVAVNTPVLLEIEAMPLLSGTVIWLERGELGLRFDQPLHEAVLDHLIGRSALRRT